MDQDFNPFKLACKNILVTGASSGIGRAIAVACAKMGANVYITGRNELRLQETASATESTSCVVLPADLGEAGDVESLVAALPKLDGVAHCAGITARKACRDIEESDLQGMFKTNLFATTLLQAALLRQRKINKSASIVMMASRAASFPAKGVAVYSATKGALVSYAKCLALELAARQIRVNCICPGMVWTPMISEGAVDVSYMEADQNTYPLKRYGKPEDIAYLALYLLSDASAWMTGSCIDISGGGYGVLN